MRNRLMTLLTWVAPWAARDPAILRLGQAAVLVIGLFPFVAIGPHVQLYLTSILHASAPTIYGTAYQEQLVEFPTLTEWIKYLFAAWFHWVTAALVCLAALRCTRARDAFVTAWAAAFVALTAGDLVFGLMCDEASCNCSIVCEEVTGAYVFKNVISNFAGGALLAGVFVALVELVRITWGWLSRGPIVALILSSIAPIATGLVCLLLGFYALQLFYAPVPIAVDLTLEAPSSYSAVRRSEGSLSAHDSKPLFFPIPSEIGAGSVHVTAPIGALRADWSKDDNLQNAALELRFFAGCATGNEVQKIADRAAPLILPLGRDFRLTLDAGHTELVFPPGSLNSSQVTTQTESPWIVHLQGADEKSAHDVSFFAPDDSAIVVTSDGVETYFLVLMYLVDIPEGKENSKTELRSRKLSIQTTPGTSTNIEFQPPAQGLSPSKTIVCSPISSLPANRSQIVLRSRQLIAGVGIRVKRPVASIEELPLADSRLRINGITGWIAANGLVNDKLMYANPAPISLLQARGNIVVLEIDAVERKSHPLDYWTFRGDLLISYDQLGRVRVRGNAREAWRDQSRLNPTRWERLATEWRASLLAIAGVVGLGLLGIARFVWKTLAKNKRLGLPT